MNDPVVIIGMARSPMGGFQGDLSPLTAPELGTVAIKAALERGNVSPDCIDETLMGCVLPAGLRQAPARQASIGSGIPAGAGCTTVNKMRGSGMKAVMLGRGESHRHRRTTGKANIDKIPQLKPAFNEGGTVTAANSSSISDGAAALVLMSQSEAVHRGLAPLARIIEHSSHAQEPAWFTTAPVTAIRKVLDKTGWAIEAVDLYEINEAFAVVPMAAMRELDLPRDKVNVNGGACALGHPVGASGARIMITLIAALKDRGLKRGVAGICIGGGEATAISLELL